MNWDTIFIIATLVLVVGAMLVPALMLTPMLARLSKSQKSRNVTLRDIVLAVLVVTVLLTLFALHQFYPDHPFVRWLWTPFWFLVLPVMYVGSRIIIARSKNKAKDGA